eukprot:scaffold44023_cov21-Tisochrysis_lutea.AAC.3
MLFCHAVISAAEQILAVQTCIKDLFGARTARDPHNQNTPLAKQKPANRLEQSTKHTAGCLRAAKRTLAFHDKTNKYIMYLADS